MRRAVAPILVVSLAVANGIFGVASCSSFDEEPGTDAGSATEGGSDLDAAADALDASPPPNPPITCIAGTTKSPDGGLARQSLYAPTAADVVPYGLATDATHVAWLEQTWGPSTSPFDVLTGIGLSRLVRVPKVGGSVQELARDQRGAVSVQIDGELVYWTTWEPPTAKMLRVSVNSTCATVCPTPDVVATFPDNVRVSKFFRFSPGVFLAQGDDGPIYFVRPNEKPVPILVTGGYPGLVVTSASFFASTETGNAKVQRSTVSATPLVETNFLEVPPADGGGAQVGVGHLATDCTSLWMTRYFYNGRVSVYAHDFAKPGSFDFVIESSGIVSDLVADASYGWAAVAGQGVYAVSRGEKKAYRVHEGDVNRLAVDDDGVYFGERGSAQKGTVFMIPKR